MIDQETIQILLVAGDLKIYYPEIYSLAEFIHDTYETKAKLTGWNTQENCKVDFEVLPVKNKETMLMVADAIRRKYIINLS